jgi:hypothetical protein
VFSWSLRWANDVAGKARHAWIHCGHTLLFCYCIEKQQVGIISSSGGSIQARASTDTQRLCSEQASWVFLTVPKLGPASLASEATTMAARLYHNERWTDEDDRLLRTMSETGKSLTLMTVKLGRPMASIKARAEDLGIGIPGTGIGQRRKRRQTV